MNLKSEQKRFYELLPKESSCFVRVSANDDALWVCDLPRRNPDCMLLVEKLQAEGYAVRLDRQKLLWQVDWTEERWETVLESFQCQCPPLPEDPVYQEAYALCRFWLFHPAEFGEYQLSAVRRVIKLAAEQPQQMLKNVRSLHRQAAEQLRKGQPGAFAAGRVLAGWLYEHAYGKEQQL